ncbi:MAG: hypothetical protein LBI95_03410 [Holosporales bacterium]|nr:hypothetical protein [Holosporales bacterium]
MLCLSPTGGQGFKTVVPDGASAFAAGRMVRASRHSLNILCLSSTGWFKLLSNCSTWNILCLRPAVGFTVIHKQSNFAPVVGHAGVVML